LRILRILFFVKVAGEYNYKVVDKVLTIDNSKKYNYDIKADTLTLNYLDNPQISDGELTLIYVKE